LAELGSFAGAVIDRVAEGLCVWHEIEVYPHICVTVWNPRMAEITGYSKNEMNRYGWFDTLCRDAEVTVRMKERMNRMWQGEDLLAEEWVLIRKDGATRCVSISTSLIELDGDAPHALACVHDVSDIKGAVDALCKSEERFRKIAESVQDVFWLQDSDRILYVNPAYEALWGKSCESLYQDPSSFMDSIHPEDAQRVRAAVETERMPPRGGFNEEYRIILPDGSVRWIHARSFPVQSDCSDGETVGMARDVTALKESRAALQRSRDGLEREVQERTAELNRRQKQLETANRRLNRENAKRRRMSEKLVDLIEQERHEISMSLHEDMAQSMAILGIQLDYVQKRLGGEKKDLCSTLEKAKALVGIIIGDMKRLSRGFGSDVLSHLGLVAAIQSLAEQIETAGIEIGLDLTPGVEERISPKKRLALFRIAQEALTNVVKHGRASRVHVGLTGENGEACLTVEDDGCGFNPKKAAGISHGLLIMEERSVQCGGELTVESDGERGTLVIARIPVDPEA
jgi:PAS domain S-box-containing protein